jgi:hypothetical protein
MDTSNNEAAGGDELATIHSPAQRIVGLAMLGVLLVAMGAGALYLLNRSRIAAEDAPTDICMATTDPSGVDWPSIHQTLLPTAFIERSDASRQAVLAALPAGGRESELIGEFLQITVTVDDANSQLRASQLIDEWNTLLWSRGVPWRLALPMDPRLLAQGPLAMSYCVVAAASASVDNGEPVPVFVTSRQDNIGIRESYAGHAGDVEQAAVILGQRVADIAWNIVWPALATPDETSTDYETAFHTLVTRELESLLGAETLTVLVETAEARRALVRFRDSTTERNGCGGGMMIATIPLRGFADDEIVSFREIATPDHVGGCPAMTISEFEQVRAASSALRQRSGVRAAVDALTAQVARSVAVHEVRHVADIRLAGGRTCAACSHVPERAYVEMSAYGASFSAADGGVDRVRDARSRRRWSARDRVGWPVERHGRCAVYQRRR